MNTEEEKKEEKVALYQLIDEFREWNRQWELYSNYEHYARPKDSQEFISYLEEKYNITYK